MTRPRVLAEDEVCIYEWVSKRESTVNDEIHPEHRCGRAKGHLFAHKCGCGATAGTKHETRAMRMARIGRARQ